MKINISRSKINHGSNIIYICLIAVFSLTGFSNCLAQDVDDTTPSKVETKDEARVTGLSYICVHVLQLEKTLKLYREILGFKLSDAEIYHGPGLEGMLALKLKAGDLNVTLSLTAPEFWETVGPVGNTNHNHFSLKVNDIKTIGDKLKKEGYELENENYARDKYTFFVGPNGEIIGLSGW